jgi:hypothetical protein
MMGRQTADQGALFYEFRLEDRVLETHLLRRSNAVIAAVLASLHKDLAPYYSSTGRPSIDPELMIRMLIVGYCYGIRLERRLHIPVWDVSRHEDGALSRKDFRYDKKGRCLFLPARQDA